MIDSKQAEKILAEADLLHSPSEIEIALNKMADEINQRSALPGVSKNEVDPTIVSESLSGSDSNTQASVKSETAVAGVIPSLLTIE